MPGGGIVFYMSIDSFARNQRVSGVDEVEHVLEGEVWYTVLLTSTKYFFFKF